jgi:hypothetical protein
MEDRSRWALDIIAYCLCSVYISSIVRTLGQSEVHLKRWPDDGDAAAAICINTSNLQDFHMHHISACSSHYHAPLH